MNNSFKFLGSVVVPKLPDNLDWDAYTYRQKTHNVHKETKTIPLIWDETLKGEVIYLPKRPGEPDCTWADISKITTELDWKPSISFQEGVSKMVAEIDNWKDAPLWDTESIRKATKTWFQFMNKENK